MKIEVSKEVAVGAIGALAQVAHPDVRSLTKTLMKRLGRSSPGDVATAREWEAVLGAIDIALVTGLVAHGDGVRSRIEQESVMALLRTARPKVEGLLRRQRLREPVLSSIPVGDAAVVTDKRRR